MRAVGALTDPAAPDKIKMPQGHFYFILVVLYVQFANRFD